MKLSCDQITIRITGEEVAKIEAFTQSQSKSSAWFIQRAGRITASSMKSVCRTDPGNPSQSLIWYIYICYPNCNKFSSPATNWGCEHEPLARTEYMDVMSTTHKNFVCKQSGLVVSATHPFISTSPDGLVECDCCGQGVLEIKCPYCFIQRILMMHLSWQMGACLQNMLIITKFKHSYMLICGSHL